jgi:hypothetical protein
MLARALLTLALCATLTAARKPQPVEDGVASNDSASIKATVYADPETVQQILGNNLDGHYIVLSIEIHPNRNFTIDHDNFLLRTDKDGEKAHPYEPSQIAGSGVLVVSTAEDEQQAAKKNKGSGITLGGGMGPIMGGASPGVPVSTAPTKVVMKEGNDGKNPLLATLESRMLPQKAVAEPTSGLLYFPMEKQKVKDLELIVTTPSGKLSIRFSK